MNIESETAMISITVCVNMLVLKEVLWTKNDPVIRKNEIIPIILVRVLGLLF